MTHIFEEWKKDLEREDKCSELVNRYSLYARQLFSAYEPLLRNEPLNERPFLKRLDRWIRNWHSDEDRWDAFRLVDHIFFIGEAEFQELFRIAFETNLWGWIAESSPENPASTASRNAVKESLKKTWCCPITDSLRISSFRHFNHIEAPDFFPDWRSLAKFGDPEKVKKYIHEAKIERIVLIEDFVGSGKQATTAVEFAVALGLPVLLLPLIVGERGDSRFRELATKYPNLTYEPVVRLNSDFIISKEAENNEDSEIKNHRRLIEVYSEISNDKFPYGFEQREFGENQGYLVVLYTNCPNNTINAIHKESGGEEQNTIWTALFPRSGRSKRK